MKPILIVGAGLAGYTVARELRKLDKVVPIVIVTADGGGFYSKPMLSNAFAQGKTAAQLASHNAEKMAQELNATILSNTQVLALDLAAQTIRTDSGQLEYAKLVLATGASPIRLKLGGDAGDSVMSVNHLDHYRAFRDQLDAKSEPSRIAILGAGLIGCEFADDLAGARHVVTLIDPQTLPLAAIAPHEVGRELAEALVRRGVTLRLGTSAIEVNHVRGALDLQLADGSTVAADIVLSAVGLRADLQLAQAAGLSTERGILVDPFGQTSAAHVYALGDCAQYCDETGMSTTLPYIAPLMSAGRAIARTLAGTPTRIDLKPAPVIVKTPSCPIALVPAPSHARESGSWHGTRDGAAMLTRFYDINGTMLGFAVTGKDPKLRQKLQSELGSKLVASVPSFHEV
jgi:rubredoxin-NAD+ reductase